MTRDLHEKIGEVSVENLFAGLDPKPQLKPGILRKLSAKATLTRGTLLAKSSGSAGDGKLVIFGTAAASNETLTPWGVLADDTEVGTTDDENVLVYISGHFNELALTLASGATISEADRDALRAYGILLGNSQNP